MGSIKQIIIDSFNGFSPADIPLFIFQLLMAGLLGFAVQFIFNKKLETSERLQNSITIAIMVALTVALSKVYLPFAIVAAVIILLLGKALKKESLLANMGIIVLLIAAAGCGFGSIVQTVIGIGVLLFLTILAPVNKG